MAVHFLSDTQVRQAKPKDKDYKLSDGGGLYLLVKQNGAKCWRYDYRFGGKRKTLACGTYPVVSLKMAREAVSDAKSKLISNVDPSQDKQRKRREEALEQESIFSALAREWWEHQKGTWTEVHAGRVWNRMKEDVVPYLGHLPIDEIQPQDIL